MSRGSLIVHHPEQILCDLLVVVGLAAASQAETVKPSPYWSNTISFPGDPFRAQGPNNEDVGWVKFTVFASDPTKVYFQDSNQYAFHYDFGVDLVEEYAGMTPTEFDQITLHDVGQQAILGAVIMPHWTQWTPPAEVIHEYGIQFVRQDPYDPAEVVTLFNLVRDAVSADPGVEVFYFPSYEQAASAEANREFFASQGIIVSSPARWATGNICYARGWALGELKYFESSAIDAAYLSGALVPGDILLTDAVPAEIPIVAGIITLSPSTPNSHVAILAGTYGIPFVYLALADDAARAQQLVGRQIALRAYDNNGACDARLIDVENALTPEQMDEILDLKSPPPLSIAPAASYGAYSAPTDGLVLADIQYFGGKAANFGLLRRSIPANSPVSTAISFDLWSAFLDQTLTGGQTLGDEIAARLAGYSYPPPNMAVLAAELDAIRDSLFKDDVVTSFSPELQAAVIDTLIDPQYGFDLDRKIRFRSSTNVEDSEQFVGAGLYDSFSGCLADDLDGDEYGPSLCDPTEPEERGVFRAIHKVFASFYNDNALLERLRFGINENDVGMGLLVHHSFPDEIELANGVATLSRSGSARRSITLVTQDGAVSVSNPTDGSIPEEVEVTIYSTSTYLTLVTYSNLLPLGATVMDWEDDYRDLTDLLLAASQAFEQETGKTSYVLDFEYKKVAPNGELVVKQIRELPQLDTSPTITPFLINEPANYCLYQGEHGEVFGNHRLKLKASMQTRSTWLDEGGLGQSLYADTVLEFNGGSRIRSLTGLPSSWPQAWYVIDGTTTTDGWSLDDLANPHHYLMKAAGVGMPVSPAESPLLTLRDLGQPSGFGFGCLEFQVDYERPEVAWDWQGPTTTTTDHGLLCPCFPERPDDQLQVRALQGDEGVLITTTFYWPKDPGFAAGYTAPLVRWVETVISGYTSQPITLHNDYAQTYRPEHHNFSEHFIFEPQLDPGVSPPMLIELRSKDIRLIHVFHDPGIGSSTFATYGYDLAPADFDGDEDVDQEDFGRIQACLSGPDIPPDEPSCALARLDGDEDVDGDDVTVFQSCSSGPEVPADPGCGLKAAGTR